MTRLAVFSILFTLFIVATPALAQEADPYSDYSYLWADDKSKKKKKEKKNEVAESAPVVADSIPPIDSLQLADTLQLDSIPQDSLINEEITPIDTTDNYYDNPFGEEEVKKEKVDALPIEDFRTPLSRDAVGAGSFIGGFTYTQIGGEDYVGLVLAPEFSIGKVGVGMSVPILYGLESNEFRSEYFEGGVGWARIIRYIRYGNQKVDPVYVRVGSLDGLMMGYGGLINNYTNTTSFEKRKIGLHTDINYQGLFGVEAMYSDFDPASQNLLGIRPYVRPLAKTPVPIIRTLEFGATFVSDKDQTSIRVNDSTSFKYAFTADGISAFGLDVGMSVLRTPFIQIDLFANYGKLNVLSDTLRSAATLLGEPNLQKGSGSSFGSNFRMHFVADAFSTDIRIERLSYSRNYLPQFFDATYELNKDARILSLTSAESAKGIYGSLTGHILQKVQLGGSLLIPDKISETAPALVRLNADVERLADKFSMHASYTKTNLSDLGDAFTLNENSLAKVSLIYHMNRFLATGLVYFYYWEPAPEGGLRAINYVMPYFGLSIDF